MKKLLVLLLALAMVFALVSCGSSSDSDSSDSDAEEVEEVEEEPAEEEEEAEPAEEETAEEPAEEETAEAVEVEPLSITLATSNQEAETAGQVIDYFVDTLNEISGGAITVEVWWGGTVFDDTAMLEGLSSGSANMSYFTHSPHIDVLYYLAFPAYAPGGTQAALDYFQTLMFDDPETSAIIQGQAAENNIIYLSSTAGGANAICSTNEFTDLASMAAASSSFGTGNNAIWEPLGFQCTAVFPTEMYDALNRGLIDTAQMALTPMVSMSFQEVADYWALDGTYASGSFFTANLDWWNSLSDAQSELVQQAADAAREYSGTIFDASMESDMATIEAATGNAFIELSDEDLATFWSACFEASADEALDYASIGGDEAVANMVTVLEKAAELTDYDWVYEG